MTVTPPEMYGNPTLRRTLSAKRITVMIIAVAAPLGTVVVSGPIGIIFGNGTGFPGTFLLAGWLLLCFAVGYTALMRAIPGEGGFYTYITHIFGRDIGAGSACVAAFSYLMLTAALATITAYFNDLTAEQFGWHLGFKVWAALTIAVVAMLGARNIDVAAKVVVPLVLVEFLVLMALVAGIFAHRGAATFPLQAVSPSHIFVPGFGVSLMFALGSFIGVESAALFSGEATNPAFAIPRATMAAIAIVAVAYFLGLWSVVGDIGWRNMAALAIKGHTDVSLQQGLVIDAYRRNLGAGMATLISVMLCTSNFACYLSVHNAATRYAFTLGKQGILPGKLAVPSKKSGSPAYASNAISLCVIVIASALVLLHVDYVAAFAPAFALGTIGVIALQAFVAVGTVVYFRRQRDTRTVTTVLCPIIACLGFLCAAVLIVMNYTLMSGSASWAVNATPALFIPIFAYGYLVKRKS